MSETKLPEVFLFVPFAKENNDFTGRTKREFMIAPPMTATPPATILKLCSKLLSGLSSI